MKQKFWTEEEEARARELVDRGVGADEFFQIMGRTKSAFFSHTGVKRRRERFERAMKTGLIVPKVEVPAELYEDAHRRAMAPRSLTASIFGDPPVGWRALDRMGAQHGEV